MTKSKRSRRQKRYSKPTGSRSKGGGGGGNLELSVELWGSDKGTEGGGWFSRVTPKGWKLKRGVFI